MAQKLEQPLKEALDQHKDLDTYSKEFAIEAFFQHYFRADVTGIMYKGITTLKNPMDLWLYQEIICKISPDVIVETGTAYGGSAHYLADTMTNLGLPGKVITIDIRALDRLPHPKIQYVHGSSLEQDWIHRDYKDKKVLVILDSDHSTNHVLREMQYWGPLVSPGRYMIVEDTCFWGKDGNGPRAAVNKYFELHPFAPFVIDKSMHRLMLTYNPDGYLRKL